MQHGERRAQLVARIGHEGPLPRQCPAQAHQQVVHGPGQSGDLVVRAGHAQRCPRVAFRQRGHFLAQPFHRGQRGASQPVGADTRDEHKDRAADEQPNGDLAKRSVIGLERDAGDRHAPFAEGGGEHPLRLPFESPGQQKLSVAGLIQLGGREQRCRSRVGALDLPGWSNGLDDVLAGRQRGRGDGRLEPSSSSEVCPAWLSRAARFASVVRSIAAESWLMKSQPPRVNAIARASANTSAIRSRIDIAHTCSSWRSR